MEQSLNDQQRKLMSLLSDKHGIQASGPDREVVLPPPGLVAAPEKPTKREVEVLVLISEGFNNVEIARQLFLSEETIKSHVKRLFAKLEARNRAHAVSLGYRRRILKLKRV